MNEKMKLIRLLGEMEGFLRGITMSYDISDELHGALAKKADELRNFNQELIKIELDVHTMD
jgi:hypothetical protein